MKIQFLLFSQMRLDVGSSSIELELPEPSSVSDAMEALAEFHPPLRPHFPSCMTAVGVDYVTTDHLLADGDELSLIPPVQGG